MLQHVREALETLPLHLVSTSAFHIVCGWECCRVWTRQRLNNINILLARHFHICSGGSGGWGGWGHPSSIPSLSPWTEECQITQDAGLVYGRRSNKLPTLGGSNRLGAVYQTQTVSRVQSWEVEHVHKSSKYSTTIPRSTQKRQGPTICTKLHKLVERRSFSQTKKPTNKWPDMKTSPPWFEVNILCSRLLLSKWNRSISILFGGNKNIYWV